MIEITFLGIGSATPAEPGDYTALLIRGEGHTLLIDAGPAVMVQLGRLGLRADHIDRLLVTHSHGDHILGWPMLLFRQTPIEIIALPRVLNDLQALVQIVYPELESLLRRQVTFRAIEPGDAWSSVGAFPLVVHAAPSVHNGASLAYRLEFPHLQRSITYSGDTAPSPEMARLAQGCDLLIHEATYLYPRPDIRVHSSAGQAAEIAAEAGCGALALVHRDGGEPQDPEPYEAEVRRFYEGVWWLPRAGETWILSADGLMMKG